MNENEPQPELNVELSQEDDQIDSAQVRNQEALEEGELPSEADDSQKSMTVQLD